MQGRILPTGSLILAPPPPSCRHLLSAPQGRHARGVAIPRASSADDPLKGSDARSSDWVSYPEVASSSKSEPQEHRHASPKRLADSYKQEVFQSQQALRPTSPLRYVQTNPWAKGAVLAATLLLVGTLISAATRVVQRYNSPQSKRRRSVDQNMYLVEALGEYLPANRAALTTGVAQRLKLKCSFTTVEVFRKYLWFLLRERKFDESAVADLVALKAALRMSDDEVAAALRERAQRVYDQYGNIMMDVAGMTKAGIERKATCRALFSKLLFLAECEDLLPQEGAAASQLDIPAIFGATADDANQLRIVSLVEVDLDNLEGQFSPDPDA